MKKFIAGLAVAGLIAGASPVFAEESEVRHQIDSQKQQAKVEYEKQRDQLKSKYQGDDLEQRLQKAHSNYVAKAKMLDQKKKVGEDSLDVNQNNQ